MKLLKEVQSFTERLGLIPAFLVGSVVAVISVELIRRLL